MKENDQQKTSKTTHRLTVEQLKQATIILKQEQKNCSLSSSQKVSYNILKILVIVFLVYTLLQLFFPIEKMGEHQNYALLSLIIILTIMFPVAFVMNIPLMRKGWRQNRLFKKYKTIKFVDYQLRHKKFRLMDIITGIVLGLGGQSLLRPIYIFSAVIVNLLSKSGYKLDVSKIAFLVIYFVVGFSWSITLISWGYIRKIKMRLESLAEMKHIQQSFLQYLQKAEKNPKKAMSIPEKDFERIASVEKSQIARQTLEAIMAYKQELKKPPELRTQTYFVRKSSEVLKKIKKLSITQRLLIETQIEELMIEPRPRDSKKIQPGVWRKRIPESSLEILYTIEDDDRNINISDIFRYHGRSRFSLTT